MLPVAAADGPFRVAVLLLFAFCLIITADSVLNIKNSFLKVKINK